MTYDLIRLGVGVVAGVPARTPEVGTRKPRLVDVDHVIALAIYREHLLGVEGAENLVSL